MEDNKFVLEVSDLHTTFKTDNGDVSAVNGVSFKLEPGKTLGIVGESGSGKSVTAYSIMQILAENGAITGGSVKYKGEDITKWNKKKMADFRGKCCSIIFQDPMTSLNPVFTVGYQLEEAVLLHTDRTKKEAKERAIEMLTLVGVNEPEKRVNQYPHELSGGMRQRIMIAMALVCNPKLLIADEPTTALDVTIQAQILDLMNQLKKETGTSILFITHDLGVVAEVCDDVAVMYCGRVVERGDVKTIFANPSHPYTKGLLGSIPRLGDAGKELKSIPGNVPNPKYMPKGCKFAPRCPYASEKCREEEPGFFQIEEGHISRCWLCESGQLKTDHVEKAGD